jgi:hypothetical protein
MSTDKTISQRVSMKSKNSVNQKRQESAKSPNSYRQENHINVQ